VKTKIKKNILIFNRRIEHYTAAANHKNFPDLNLPEICFAGRSNVGKSSLINAICNKRSLARTSNTPGRTQLIHFYNMEDSIIISDLPGYGYAKAPKEKINNWNKLINKYFVNRSSLIRAFILIDSRRGIKDNDKELMNLLNVLGVNFQCILTKSDKVTESYLKNIYNETKLKLNEYAASYPEVIITSSKNKIGIEKIHSYISQIEKKKRIFNV
tara:strand:+ start:5329 stop:5970 length:642 start_codon:yes stop_codon:yes gene_type:complete